jgi:hypothetical protein
VSSSISKQYSTTKIIDCKIYWVQFGFQAYMEAAFSKKGKQIDLKVEEVVDWIIGHKSLSLDSKVLLYKTIIKPICTYGINLQDYY